MNPRNTKTTLRAPKKKSRKTPLREFSMSPSAELQKSRFAPTVMARDTTPIMSTITNNVFIHDSSDEKYTASDIGEENVVESEDSGEEMADTPTSNSKNITTIEEPTIIKFTVDMVLD
ncbi:hypothetical protein INT48_003751 [Thamnidium elegans]|uniref:Uncharacterized protein n=1 Tax=Thamnidium elegans TaxID=101142 RepID=A0A8H7VX19_9FUNG|nr:hypothetical protein INT48_003751 [Thamnidium elegans]